MRLTIIYLLTAAVLMSAASCEEAAEQKTVASRFELTLGEYFNESGEQTTRKWEAEDEVALLYYSGGSIRKATSAPLMSGRKEGLFMFSWEGYENGRELVAYYPADAPVSFGDGEISVDVPTVQDGSFPALFIGRGWSNGSAFMDADITLEAYWHTFHVSLGKGDYSVSKAEFRSEKLNIDVNLAAPIDCRTGGGRFYICMPEMTLSKGYSIVMTTDNGKTFEFEEDGSVSLQKGEMTEIKDAGASTELVVCGDNMIYIIDAEKAAADTFESAVKWQWDAQGVASTVGGSMIRLDDCKPVDNGTKILATSSYSWAVLVDIRTSELLWWAYPCKNAHSAELLPGGRIAVACSSGETGNRIQIYDIETPGKVLSEVTLESAHGVVWNEKTQRLYAIGGTSLNIYSLKDWETQTPSLNLVETVSTSDYVTSLHDLTLVNDNTLLVAGNHAALYDIPSKKFSRIPHFNSSTALKSVNYNAAEGVCWYTDATDPQYHASYDWATNTIFYTSNVAGNTIDQQIRIPEGMNMYKVRILNW